ncbi:preprotein translocase subunit SecA [Lactobacillus sp. ESL0791]|uniref:preprotein translocase subunit SecA n=1 Tax=Lactobacillus sp. ESL0791 TaxID=2983234 RepID=UPI0023F88F0B|nr:preprotein translocase subunit SecA [Lactobacillus sp. ESL0791]MDF7639674.1 preprotein translocase subunit SecA [Lactobacillus sp. ESL0791]
MHIKNHLYWCKTAEIIKLTDKYKKLSDDKLRAKTAEFRRRLRQGVSLNSLLVEAYAVVCVADSRVIGLTPYPVQIFGAVAMQYHNVIEMKTGEGKTLTATMPMYLHGLTGKGNFLITANLYLAKRDALNVGRVYRWLGLKIGYNFSQESKEERDNAGKTKKGLYANDIVYTDGGTFGFDYLTNNLVSSVNKQYMPPFRFALIDEVDSVLLDLATTPLVISGRPEGKSNYPGLADKFVKICQEDVDFALNSNRKKVWFLHEGILHANEFFGVRDILDKKYADLYGHLVFALQASQLYQRDRDYLLEKNKLVLIDTNSGRKLLGMEMSAGIHQAIETKEGLETSQKVQVIATITYQNLFRLFPQLAGMTGTAMGDKRELMRVYNLNVVAVPTNRPNIRRDEPDRVFYTAKAKLYASLEVVKKNYRRKRPVLIETGSLTLSNLYSEMLLQEHIPHNLLNARSTAQEAEMIKIAGQSGMVTVSTSLAGRGADIILSDRARRAGGLLVIGTEKMSLKRIDDQLRGRAGRQGDPGSTVFFTSLQDNLVRQFPSRKIKHTLARHAKDRRQEIGRGRRRYQRLFARLQNNIKYHEQSTRFMVLEYGEIARLQREAVYRVRGEVMQMNQELEQVVLHSIKKAIITFVSDNRMSAATVNEYICDNITPDYVNKKTRLSSAAANIRFLNKIAMQAFKEKKRQIVNEDAWQYYQRLTIVKAIDDAWVDQVDNLETLRIVTAQRATGQSNPLFEYQKEALASFDRMKADISRQIMRNVLCSEVTGNNVKGMQIYFV